MPAQAKQKTRLAAALAAGLVVVLVGLACGGTKNVADCPNGKSGGICSPQTPDEQAQAKLNDGDYDGAITILTDLLTSEPTGYQRLPILAAAYASRSGVNLLTIAKSQFSGGGSLTDVFSKFIPTPKSVGAAAYKTHVADMKSAVNSLKLIPAQYVSSDSASSYASSAILQQTLYTAAYSIMFLNQFAISPTTGQLDPAQLATMTEADAENILDSFASTGQIPALGNNAAVQQQVAATLAKINAEPGDTSKDKIAAYVAAQKSSGTTTTGNSSGTNGSGT